MKILTTKEVAGYLRCHPTTVYRMVREHKLPCFRIGADYRFEESAIEQWVASNLGSPESLWPSSPDKSS